MSTDANHPKQPTDQPTMDGPAKLHDHTVAESAVRVGRQFPSWVRLGIPVAVIVGGGIFQAVIWQMRTGDSTRQVMSVWMILPTVVFLLLLWWLFLSGVRWTVRLAGVGLAGVAAGMFFGAFRVKDFTGDMIPEFEYRWQESAEQKAADYWKTQSPQSPAADGHAAKTGSTGSGGSTSQIAELAVAANDWPQFDGLDRDGIAHGVRLRTDWNTQPPRMLWRHPVGAGWGAFAVVGKYAFTQEQRGGDEAVVCYDAQTGKQIWVHLDGHNRFNHPLGGLGPRATPTVLGSRVYTFGGTGILNCFDPHTGAVIWSTNAVKDASTSDVRIPLVQFGMSGSPLVFDNVVVVNPGGKRTSMKGTDTTGRALIAYDRNTGKELWAAGDYQAGYASPILATLGGVRQIVIFDAVGAAGHDAATGKELWRSIEWKNDTLNNIAQPIIQPDGSVFLSSGYGRGSILFDVKKTDSGWTTENRWKAENKFKLKFNSGVYRDGFVYGLDEGILACFDLATGTQRWKKGRYKYGQILLLENVLFVISEEGDAVLVDISPGGSSEIAKFHAIDGKTWNHPALSRGRIYVRNGEEAACYDLGELQTASR